MCVRAWVKTHTTPFSLSFWAAGSVGDKKKVGKKKKKEKMFFCEKLKLLPLF